MQQAVQLLINEKVERLSTDNLKEGNKEEELCRREEKHEKYYKEVKREMKKEESPPVVIIIPWLFLRVRSMREKESKDRI